MYIKVLNNHDDLNGSCHVNGPDFFNVGDATGYN